MSADRAAFALRVHNPDVLTCIANLSNDEVFTPPDLANKMLDTLADAWSAGHDGAILWADPTVRFLDPFAKSGVFLREIVKRLVAGLADQIPDLQERVDHVLTNQVYGIAITELTSLLVRRSLYCSKWANGEHSIARSFDTSEGNVSYERIEHTWVKGRCRFCGAPQQLFDRGDDRDTHAYAFIHADDIKSLVAELFGAEMQFDVVIGNPPYQMTGGAGGTNDSPLYNLFVQQAKTLDPRYISMVVPSRWMAGGRGLADFRGEMLGDGHVRMLVDYENAKDLFPTLGIIGGICYFLWDRDQTGTCRCTYHRNGVTVGPQNRMLDEFDVFVRDPRAVGIVHKVRAREEPTFDELVSGDTPFGLATNFSGYTQGAAPREGELRLYANVGTTRVQGAVDRDAIRKNTHLVDTWKLFLPVAGSGRERERSGVDLVLGPPIVAGPGSVCTQTYLVAGPLESREQAESIESYLRTRFARFLVSLRKPSQHVFRGMYQWLPQQSWDREWTDAHLYDRYDLSDDDVSFIESMIRPMDIAKGIDG